MKLSESEQIRKLVTLIEDTNTQKFTKGIQPNSGIHRIFQYLQKNDEINKSKSLSLAQASDGALAYVDRLVNVGLLTKEQSGRQQIYKMTDLGRQAATDLDANKVVSVAGETDSTAAAASQKTMPLKQLARKYAKWMQYDQVTKALTKYYEQESAKAGIEYKTWMGGRESTRYDTKNNRVIMAVGSGGFDAELDTVISFLASNNEGAVSLLTNELEKYIDIPFEVKIPKPRNDRHIRTIGTVYHIILTPQ